MKLYAFVLPLVLFYACSPTPSPEPPKPPGPDAWVEGATCADACNHMAILGCEEAKPTPKGATCVEVCENVQNSGVMTWNLDCLMGTKSCAQVDVCDQ